MTLRHIISGTYCDRNQRPCPTDERGKLRCDCVIDDEDDAIYRSLERQDLFYRDNPRSIPGEGSTQPIGIEERYKMEAEKRRRREAGLPE